MSNAVDTSRFTTAKVRIAFSEIWEAKDKMNSGREMFSCCLIIRKDDLKTIERFNLGIKNLTDAAIAANSGKKPAGFRNPLRDADLDPEKMNNDNFKGCYFVNCSTKLQPRVVDRNRNQLTAHDSVVSGDYIRIAVNLFSYVKPGNSGVGVGFSSIQLVEKGAYMGGGGAEFDDEFDDEDKADPFADEDDINNII